MRKRRSCLLQGGWVCVGSSRRAAPAFRPARGPGLVPAGRACRARIPASTRAATTPCRRGSPRPRASKRRAGAPIRRARFVRGASKRGPWCSLVFGGRHDVAGSAYRIDDGRHGAHPQRCRIGGGSLPLGRAGVVDREGGGQTPAATVAVFASLPALSEPCGGGCGGVLA